MHAITATLCINSQELPNFGWSFCCRCCCFGLLSCKPLFGQSFSCRTHSFTFDSGTRWHTKDFMVNSVTTSCGSKQNQIFIPPPLCLITDIYFRQCFCFVHSSNYFWTLIININPFFFFFFFTLLVHECIFGGRGAFTHCFVCTTSQPSPKKICCGGPLRSSTHTQMEKIRCLPLFCQLLTVIL